MSEYIGTTTRTSNLPVAASAFESEPTTSASPPVCMKGVHSDATNKIFFLSLIATGSACTGTSASFTAFAAAVLRWTGVAEAMRTPFLTFAVTAFSLIFSVAITPPAIPYIYISEPFPMK